MLEIYTVSFFGHREIDHYFDLEEQVENLIRELLSTKEYVEFLIGRSGEFDQLVSTTIRRVKKIFRDDNCCHILVLPYDTAEYRNNRDSFEEYYDQIDICQEASSAHFKAAIQKRNRAMVDRSDLTVFYIERKYGGAYQTYQYAVKQEKSVIKLKTE